ncbi:MAG: hypothetical protein WC631_00375 [Candidatus Paceibacterota bacterium]|jgi:hypothetical protein
MIIRLVLFFIIKLYHKIKPACDIASGLFLQIFCLLQKNHLFHFFHDTYIEISEGRHGIQDIAGLSSPYPPIADQESNGRIVISATGTMICGPMPVITLTDSITGRSSNAMLHLAKYPLEADHIAMIFLLTYSTPATTFSITTLLIHLTLRLVYYFLFYKSKITLPLRINKSRLFVSSRF